MQNEKKQGWLHCDVKVKTEAMSSVNSTTDFYFWTNKSFFILFKSVSEFNELNLSSFQRFGVFN